MTTEERVSSTINAAVDQIGAALRDHEAADHAGEPCGTERVRAVAFLAHKLGLRADSLMQFVAYRREMQKLERKCPCCNGEGGGHEDPDAG